MLIDATHAEESRVVVMDGNRLDEIDIESAAKRQLKGNIYLAKVIRVEPSLQAAFVDYGGNRHGFLALSEIHPDYYQIPVADREALLAEQEEEALHDAEGIGDMAEEARAEPGREAAAATESVEEASAEETDHSVEEVGGDDTQPGDEVARVRKMRTRRYKIQEVIKRRQVMLIQVVKEERGNKGAAMTTYLSLAGRYCVMMPNSSRGGGVSRKIGNAKDRRRLRDIMKELDVPQGMAVIIRTAGAERTKPELKRDYEYLLKLWDQIRELTLRSSAPALVYEEANIIKRAIRDLYTRDIEEVLVEGDEAYRHAKDFMKALMPSHAKRVQPYKDGPIPLFHRYQVEQQLDTMLSNVVQLPSGGYVVINPTEALVAIDVNSGRSTRERNIEETALKTNIEAAEEVARQLRLRDLAGLIVIDFIDMEYYRNNHAVERKLKEALKNDRARIQIGRISPFGLLEMSRQRLRPSLFEASFQPCEHCHGRGLTMSNEAAAVHVLRKIEEEGLKRGGGEILLRVSASVALYILNNKRHSLASIETRYGLAVTVERDDTMIAPDLGVERLSTGEVPVRHERAITDDVTLFETEPDEESEAEDASAETRTGEEGREEGRDEEGGKRRRRRRKRRRRGGENEGEPRQDQAAASDEDENGDEDEDEAGEEVAATGQEATSTESGQDEDGEARSRRRRSRRGGRGRGRGRGRQQDQAEHGDVGEEGGEAQAVAADTPDRQDEPAAAEASGVSAEGPAGDYDSRVEEERTDEDVAQPADEESQSERVAEGASERREDNGGNGSDGHDEPAQEPEPAAAAVAPQEPKKPARRGWWNRLLE